MLLSHGNGGSARVMDWFGARLAHFWNLVVAVDHPGNNGVDAMTEARGVQMNTVHVPTWKRLLSSASPRCSSAISNPNA